MEYEKSLVSAIIRAGGHEYYDRGNIENPEAIINKIAETFSINKKSEDFLNFERSTKEKDKDKDKDSNYYRDYYLSEKWGEKLSKQALAIINDHVDK